MNEGKVNKGRVSKVRRGKDKECYIYIYIYILKLVCLEMVTYPASFNSLLYDQGSVTYSSVITFV